MYSGYCHFRIDPLLLLAYEDWVSYEFQNQYLFVLVLLELERGRQQLGQGEVGAEVPTACALRIIIR